MNKLVVYGSARIDAFMTLPDKSVGQLCNLDTGKCVIELSYSAKIPLNGVKFLVGGNGANVAVGVKRLGIDTVLSAELGQGPLADHVYKSLKEEIDVSFVTQTAGVDQGFGAVIIYQGERTILSYYAPFEPTFIDGSCDAQWAYLTSSGEKFEGYYEKIYAAICECKPKLVFNPGGRQISMGMDWLKKYLEITEVLIVNREEAQAILNIEKTHGKEKELLDSLYTLGAKKVIVTDGREGSYAKSDGKYFKAGILPVDAAERTGAGDSYSAGFLAATIMGKSVEEAMIYGTVNAASVIGFIGPEDGLLKVDEMPVWIERAKSSGLVAQEF